MTALSDISEALATALPTYTDAAAELVILTSELRSKAGTRRTRASGMQWEAGELEAIAAALENGNIGLEDAQTRIATVDQGGV